MEHIFIKNSKELYKLRKSKYVQSDLKSTFIEIKEYLEKNQLVCFSGTPCQVAGLKSYLKREYENLITVDIMCHSVPSPLFFEKYKEYILEKMKAKEILNIDFRDKRRYGYKYSMMTIETDNGIYSQGIDTDPYLRAFFGDYSVRPSCYNCRFKTQNRVSDITMWDCFNINEIDKSFDDDKGTSRILIQSKKGENILNELKDIKLRKIDLDIAITKVREMTNSVRYNSRRKNFFEDITLKNKNIKKYFPINAKTKINSLARKILSKTGLYTIIKAIAKRITGL